MEQTQKDVNRYVEILFAQLTAQATPAQFERILKQNIQMKKDSAANERDFFDRLMLNITYFVENKAIWQQLLRDTYGKGTVPKMSYVEGEVLAAQMQIRQVIAEKTDDYKALFHRQYDELQVEEEAVVYDYAYASVEHALRYDFLTALTIRPDAQTVVAGDFEETLRIIEGYVAYYADQVVNQMELLEEK